MAGLDIKGLIGRGEGLKSKYLDPFNVVGDPGGIGQMISPSTIPGPPGVGGTRPTDHPVQQDPTTGLWFDPQTGTSYLDMNGTQPVTDPNVAQQVAANYQRAQTVLGGLGNVEQERQGDVAAMGALGKQLDRTITGTAPSAADAQLGQGLSSIAAQQMAMTAGAGGPSAPLMQLMAGRNAANAATQTNQAAAILRAKEISDAENAKANLLGNMGTSASTAYGQQASLGLGLDTGAQTGEQSREQLQFNANQADRTRKDNIASSVLKNLGSAAALG